jgi:hypothetical protein
MTDDSKGSGLLSASNDDPTAAATHAFLARNRLTLDECLFANVIPGGTAHERSAASSGLWRVRRSPSLSGCCRHCAPSCWRPLMSAYGVRTIPVARACPLSRPVEQYPHALADISGAHAMILKPVSGGCFRQRGGHRSVAMMTRFACWDACGRHAAARGSVPPSGTASSTKVIAPAR